MTIHYHGTPITPQRKLYDLTGCHFCISFARPEDYDICQAIGQSLLLDNGAFSLYRRGLQIDERALYEWLAPRLYHPHRAVVLDRIDGTMEEQLEMIARWPMHRDLSWPVWHLHEPVSHLLRLSEEWPGVCLGSSGVYWKIGTTAWENRMDEAFEALAGKTSPTWVHGLRMLGHVGNRWPLASADSTNVAQNHKRDGGIKRMARRIDAIQSPAAFAKIPQGDLFEGAA